MRTYTQTQHTHTCARKENDSFFALNIKEIDEEEKEKVMILMFCFVL
jgi:hypothetical protein